MILTQDQLALENSLRRILPAGVVSCWIPDGYDKAKDIIGGNHGRCFGTHPNVPVIAPPIDQISACDAIPGWTTFEGSLSIDTDDKKEGTGSLKNTIASPEVNAKYYTLFTPADTLDWSDKENILFWLYCDRASTEFSELIFLISDTSEKSRYWRLTFSAGWTAFKLLLSTGYYETTPPPNFALTDKFYVRFKAKDDTPFYLKIDDVRVTGKPSVINPSVGWHFGGDDYVQFDSPIVGTDPYSCFAWVNLLEYPASQYTRLIGNYNAQYRGFTIYPRREAHLNPGAISLQVGRLSDTSATTATTTKGLKLYKWHLIGGVYNGVRPIAVIDDEYKLGSAYSPIEAEVNNVTVGGISARGLNGFVALPGIVKGAWSQQQFENFRLATKGLFAPRG